VSLRPGFLAVLLAAGLLAVGCDSSEPEGAESPTGAATGTGESSPAPAAECSPPQVQYKPYPGGGGLSQIPWIRGNPRDSGLVALLWYWPEAWQKQRIRDARIFTGGVAPAGYNVKVMWVFLAQSARGRGGSQLVVEGHRLDGPGTFRDRFGAIGYSGQRGAPSYASIIDVPEQGCWRLSLSTGELHAYADFRAVEGESSG
jgi:hypothetical protein